MEINDKIPMKGFWGRLFCGHSYIRITEWHRVKSFYGKLEMGEYNVALFQCQKCGKYKSKKIKR